MFQYSLFDVVVPFFVLIARTLCRKILLGFRLRSISGKSWARNSKGPYEVWVEYPRTEPQYGTSLFPSKKVPGLSIDEGIRWYTLLVQRDP